MLTLETAVAGVLLVALTIYTLLGGADFGGGVWDLFALGPRAQQQRDLIAHAIGPIWEANHVWLIVVIVVLFTAFPSAFSVIMTALFVPLMLMLLGIMLRGAMFAFRSYAPPAHQARWGAIFAIASVITPIMLGISAGTLATGRITVEDGIVTSSPFGVWMSPLPLAVGILTLALFAYLAAVYLTIEAEDPHIRDDFRKRALITAVVLEAVEIVTFLLLGSEAPRILEGLSKSVWAGPMHAAGVVASVGAIWALWTRRFYLARLFAMLQVVIILWGWGAAQYPYFIEPSITVQEAAAPVITLRIALTALGIGSLFLLPAIYYLFRIFKGGRTMSPFGGGIKDLMTQAAAAPND